MVLIFFWGQYWFSICNSDNFLLKYIHLGKRKLVQRKSQVNNISGKRDVDKNYEVVWRRKWQPTPVLLPGESHGRRGLVGSSPRGRKELGTTEQCHFTLVEMAFVVGQGVISLLWRCRGWKVSGQGMISPRKMQLAWSIRVGPKVLFCFLWS